MPRPKLEQKGKVGEPPSREEFYENQRSQPGKRRRKKGGVKVPSITDADLYWNGLADDDFTEGLNWSASPGGAPGAGPPGADDRVVIGPAPNDCNLGAVGECKSLTIIRGGVFNFTGLAFNIFGDLRVHSTEPMTWWETWTIDGGDVYIDENADITHHSSFLLTFGDSEGITRRLLDRSHNLLYLKADSNVKIIDAGAIGRIQIDSGIQVEIAGGLRIVITTYSNTDWDESALVGLRGRTWFLDNSAPAPMTVRDALIRNSHATDAIDATDGCVDGGDNVNWTFV